MDTITVRWIVVGELVVAGVFAFLMMRPEALWRELIPVGVAAFILVPLGVGLYLARLDRKVRSTTKQAERT